jgi:protein-tyrosine kinase
MKKMSRIEQALEKAALVRESLHGVEKVPLVTAECGHKEKEAAPRMPPVPFTETGKGFVTSNPLLATLFDPHSPVSEEYRKLKSVIVADARQEGFNNTIMVTSALDGEGKSMTSLNLAITLAHEYDHTVLLIDADLRKPSIADYLGVRPEKGLSDFLTEGGELSGFLYKTGIGRLTLLPAGPPVRNPVELLSSQKMKDLMYEIKFRYPDRFVIVDSPPVLLFAETRSLSVMADSVVLVVKEGKSSLKMIDEALENLPRNKMAGIVYNEAMIGSLGGRCDYYRGYRPYYDQGGAAQVEREGGASSSEATPRNDGLLNRFRFRSRR